MNPKGGCDVPLRQTPDRAGAADGDPCRRLGTDGRQSTGSQQSGAASEPAAVVQPASPPAVVELLKPEQLEALVAPIALYPDELLVNVLAASTYPLEIVQADRWLKARKTLKGDALKTEVEKQAWDDSVKALASTADVVAMMSDKIDWTKSLGDAVLAQQPDVMDAIQRLRSKAYDNKKLVTTKQQKVSVQTQESRQAIVIEQADPEYDVRAVLRSGGGLRRLALHRISTLLFRVPVLYRRGRDRGGCRLRRGLGDRKMGQLLGRRMQLGQPQCLHQPLQQDQQHREQLAAQSGASPGCEVQQRQCRQPLRQQQSEGRRQRPHGFPRKGWSGCRRPGRRSCR